MLSALLVLSSLSLTIAQAPTSSAGANAAQRPNTAFSADNAPEVGGGWREARATFYDAPDYFKEAFASRGEGSFGDILYGDCQYYSRNLGEQTVTYGNQFYDKSMVAGAASTNADYPGSCGRCYEMRCRNGLVIQQGTTPTQNRNGFDLQGIAPNTTDTQGRSFPGNPGRANGQNFVQCNNDTSSIFVTVTDTCPCTSATANNTQWCCGPVQHFDLSFWAFERLAHPLYGTMMMDFRPVDCATRQPFQSFLPGFINETIYGNRVESGWSYNVYGSDQNQLALPGAGIGGSNATCIAPRGQGGVTFTARNGSEAGYQPFGRASSVSFAIRNNGSSSTGVPQNLKFTIQNTEEELYCGGDVIPGQTHQPTSTSGSYSLFTIPIADFGCTSPSLTQVNAIGIQNIGSAPLSFCLDQFVITQPANNAVAGRKLKM